MVGIVQVSRITMYNLSEKKKPAVEKVEDKVEEVVKA